MYITVELLESCGACKEYIDFMRRHYPNGAEMKHIIERGHIPYHGLHWGYKWLTPNEEEIEAYWKRVKVENSAGVDESDHVFDSEIVSHSSRISNSKSIYSSKDISDSENIFNSSLVSRSNIIYDSSFIEGSQNVLCSQNITDSNHIIESSCIFNSHGIYESKDIINGHTIWKSETLTDCCFSYGCKNVKNALFCYQIENCEYQIFNKPIDKTRFEYIYQQYKKYALPWCHMADEWLIEKGHPTKILIYKKHVQEVPDSFYAWIKTLPGYDPMIMYSLTFNPQFLN